MITKRLKTILLFAVSSLLGVFFIINPITVSAAGQDYYVSLTGSNSNDGKTPETPKLTLRAALDLLQPGDTLYIMGGDWGTDESQGGQGGLYPRKSGRADAPITIKAYDPGDGSGPETVYIGRSSNRYALERPSTNTNDQGSNTVANAGGRHPDDSASMGSSSCLYLFDKSYIVIENLIFDYTPESGNYSARIINSSNITIKNCVFDRSNPRNVGYNANQTNPKNAGAEAHPGFTGPSGTVYQRDFHGVLLENSHDNVIENCVITEADTNLALINSNNNLVKGCVLTNAYKTLWVISGGSNNIISGGYFHNKEGSIGVISDNGAYRALNGQPSPTYTGAAYEGQRTDSSWYGELTVDGAMRNVIENNVFAYTKDASSTGLRLAGGNNIIRNNIFADLLGKAIDMTNFDDSGYYTHDNRIYNNTFLNNAGAGITLPDASSSPDNYIFYGNTIKNNVMSGIGIQVNGIRMDGFRMINNIIYGSGASDKIWTNGSTEYSLANLQVSALAGDPLQNLFKRNTDAAPSFTAVGTGAAAMPFDVQHNLALTSGGYDGEWLTYTRPLQGMFQVGGGSHVAVGWPSAGYDGAALASQNKYPDSDRSDVISLQDALYFFDGRGEPTVIADRKYLTERTEINRWNGTKYTTTARCGDWIITEQGDVAQILEIRYMLGYNKIWLDRPVRERIATGISGSTATWRGVGIAIYAGDTSSFVGGTSLTTVAAAPSGASMGVDMTGIDYAGLQSLLSVAP